MKHVCTVMVAAGLLCVGASAQAQSLADVARQEQERRKTIKTPARVYTEADVQKSAPLTTGGRPASEPRRTLPVPTSSGAPKDGAVPSADAKSPEASGEKDKAAPKDEAGWRERVQQARDDLARSRRLLSAMEQQLIGLGIQASSAAIAGQTAPDAARQQEAAREVERLRADVEKHSSTLSTLEGQVRASGIPPGWVR